MKRRDIFKYFTVSGIGAAIGAIVGSKASQPHPYGLMRKTDSGKSGAENVGVYDRHAPGYLKTVSDIINGLPVSALRFIDRSKHAGIRGRTNTDDLAAALELGIDALHDNDGGGELSIPPGLYHVTPGQIKLKKGVYLSGMGGVKPNNIADAGVVLRAASTLDDWLIDIDGSAGRVRGVGVRGIALDCGYKSRGLRANICAEFELGGLLVNQAKGEAVQFRNAWDAEIRSVFAAQCGDAARGIAAIEIQTDTSDNSNSLHFFGIRTEASTWANLAIRDVEDVGVGSSNNLQFIGCKFHLPAAPYAIPDAPNLILRPADNVAFIGGQIYDAGASHSVIDIGEDVLDRPFSYSMSGVQLEARTASQLIGVRAGSNAAQMLELRGNALTKNGNHAGSLTGIGVDAGFQGYVIDMGNQDQGLDNRLAGNTGRVSVPMGSSLSYRGAGDFEVRTDTDNRIVFYTNGAQAGYIAKDGNLFWDGKLVRANIFELRDGITAPGAGADGARLYVDAADGNLKIVFSDGTTKTIVTDSMI